MGRSAAARAFVLATLLLGARGAGAGTVVHLVSNEGQREEQEVDQVALVANPDAPRLASTGPAPDADGRAWTSFEYVAEAPAWSAALPVWRAPAWQRVRLPGDDAGAVIADWIWSSRQPAEVLAALFYPDSDNGTRFPRRFSRLHDPAGHFAHGYIPAATDSAAYVRRRFCLPLNAQVSPASLEVRADARARVFVDGELVREACDPGEQACLARIAASDGIDAFTLPIELEPGRHSVGFAVWGLRSGTMLGGLVHHLRIAYEARAANGSLASPVLGADDLSVEVRAGPAGAIPEGALVAARAGDRFTTRAVAALAPSASARVQFPASFASPGELVSFEFDAFDCMGRAAGGARNLLGGTSAGGGAYAAIGQLEETDETDNTVRARLAPAFDAGLDGLAVASETAPITGRSASGTRVRIFRGAALASTVTADQEGRFSAEVPLEIGANALTAIADADGFESASTAPITVTREAAAPPPPTIETPSPGDALATGSVQVRGTAIAGRVVEVRIDGEVRCTTTADATGAFTCDVTGLAEGEHVVEARQRSRAGLASDPASVTFSVEPVDAGPVDAGPVDAGPVDAGPVDAGDPDSGLPTRYVSAGGGGCASASGSAFAFASLVLLMALAVRRRGRVMLVLAVLAPAIASAGLPFGSTLFPGRSPLVGLTGAPERGLSFRLEGDYGRDPLVLLDARTLSPAATLVRDRVDVRAVVAWSPVSRLQLALGLPFVPLATGDVVAGLPAAGAGFGDVAGGAYLSLAQGTSLGLGAAISGTLPSAQSALRGAGAATLEGALSLGWRPGAIEAGLRLGVRSAGSGLASVLLTDPAPAPRLEARAAASLSAGAWTPFAEIAAATAISANAFEGVHSPVLASVGARWSATPAVAITGAIGRGLTAAPGSTTAQVYVGIGYVPVAPSPIAPLTDLPDPPLLPEFLAAAPVARPAPPVILVPDEGEFVRSSPFVIEGQCVPSAEVTVQLDGEPIAKVRGDEHGVFRSLLPSELARGGHSLIASQRVGAQESEPSPTRSFTWEVAAGEVDMTREARIAQILRLVARHTNLKAREVPDGVSVTTDVRFDFDSSEVKESEEVKLRQVGRLLRELPGIPVRIESHTDSIGASDYNLKLSKARAESIVRWLVSLATIERRRLQASGLGDSKPVASNDSPEGRAANRRFAECVFLVPPDPPGR